MKRIPARADITHLKKKAQELLALHRRNDAAAMRRFREALPAATDVFSDDVLDLVLGAAAVRC